MKMFVVHNHKPNNNDNTYYQIIDTPQICHYLNNKYIEFIQESEEFISKCNTHKLCGLLFHPIPSYNGSTIDTSIITDTDEDNDVLREAVQDIILQTVKISGSHNVQLIYDNLLYNKVKVDNDMEGIVLLVRGIKYLPKELHYTDPDKLARKKLRMQLRRIKNKNRKYRRDIRRAIESIVTDV